MKFSQIEGGVKFNFSDVRKDEKPLRFHAWAKNETRVIQHNLCLSNSASNYI